MMLKQLAIGCTILLLATATQAATPTTDPVGESALAERLAQMAQSNLTTRAISDITLREAASLLEAATKLDPNGEMPGDERYAHLWAEAKIKYYQGLVASERIAPEVRAHVAVRLAQELFDRGQDQQAKESLDNALKLNALDPDALEMKERQTRGSTPREHIAALLALLRGNPAQPAVESRLADELATEGLTNEAATWYGNSISVSTRLNRPTDPATFTSYLAELL